VCWSVSRTHSNTLSYEHTRTHSPTHQTVHTDACKRCQKAAYTAVPEDEPTRFETCRRQQRFNINWENCAFRWFVLCYYITVHSAKNMKKCHFLCVGDDVIVVFMSAFCVSVSLSSVRTVSIHTRDNSLILCLVSCRDLLNTSV